MPQAPFHSWSGAFFVPISPGDPVLRTIRALGATLLEYARLLPFIVLFGINGTDYRVGSRSRTKRRYLNWMAYDLFRERLTVQTTHGRTTYSYEVFGVTPRMYLRLRRDPKPSSFQTLFIHDDTHVYTSQWRWRYDGAYSNRQIKRRTAR